MILAKDKEDFFISSDLQALEKQRSVLFLEDEEILHLKNNQPQVFNFKGEAIERSFQKNFKSNPAKSEKGKHPHFMIKEILDQPEVLSSLVSAHLDKKKNQIELKLSKGGSKHFESVLKKLLSDFNSSLWEAAILPGFLQSMF